MRTQTKPQRVILVTTAIFIVRMFLFPPFKSAYDSSFFGYHF
jgi:hypothetical protein